LLHVLKASGATPEPKTAGGRTPVEGPSAQAQSYLDQVAARLREGRRVVQTRIRIRGNPAEAVLEEIGEGFCDLLALATDARSGLGAFHLGSVTEQVIRKAYCPIFTVKTPNGSGSR